MAKKCRKRKLLLSSISDTYYPQKKKMTVPIEIPKGECPTEFPLKKVVYAFRHSHFFSPFLFFFHFLNCLFTIFFSFIFHPLFYLFFPFLFFIYFFQNVFIFLYFLNLMKKGKKNRYKG